MNKTKEENCKRGNKNKDILKKLKVDETKRTKGITLMALIIIIVLLILVGISIAIFNGENGILTRASDAKIETVVATVKENLYLEQIEKVIDDKEVIPESLLAEKSKKDSTTIRRRKILYILCTKRRCYKRNARIRKRKCSKFKRCIFNR